MLNLVLNELWLSFNVHRLNIFLNQRFFDKFFCTNSRKEFFNVSLNVLVKQGVKLNDISISVFHCRWLLTELCFALIST